jgi:L,D-peptidoglycan transpeptidase YkuD (ErfK/YbiS/YcfS/YnhG family)
LVVELGYNDDPPQPGRGSAIFMHIARDDFSGTEGCIALRREDLVTILAVLEPGSRVMVTP